MARAIPHVRVISSQMKGGAMWNKVGACDMQPSVNCTQNMPTQPKLLHDPARAQKNFPFHSLKVRLPTKPILTASHFQFSKYDIYRSTSIYKVSNVMYPD